VAAHDVRHRHAGRRRLPAVTEPAIEPREAHLLPGGRREADVATERRELRHRPEAAAHGVAEPRVAQRVGDGVTELVARQRLIRERRADRVEHRNRLLAAHAERLAQGAVS
jgi:hypothetical protein